MFDSETSKSYKSMWKYRKLQSKMDMLRRVISLGVILQLTANIGKHLANINSTWQLQMWALKKSKRNVHKNIQLQVPWIEPKKKFKYAQFKNRLNWFELRSSAVFNFIPKHIKTLVMRKKFSPRKFYVQISTLQWERKLLRHRQRNNLCLWQPTLHMSLLSISLKSPQE